MSVQRLLANYPRTSYVYIYGYGHIYFFSVLIKLANTTIATIKTTNGIQPCNKNGKWNSCSENKGYVNILDID